MKRLTVAAAALAAGLFTIVAHSQAESDRFLAGHGLTATKTEKGKQVKAAADKKEVNTATSKTSKLKVASAQARKGKGKTSRSRVKLKGSAVDAQTTASVTRARPELKARARKSVVGIVGGAAAEMGKAVNTAEKMGEVARATSYTTLVSRYAAAYGVPASLAHAVITVESNYRPDMLGSAGEVGLMQIKPATARMMGYSGGAKGLFDPETNIKYGMKYLRMAHDLAAGDTCGTILRYNAGHAAKRMNPVSAAYCSKVKGML